MHKIFLDFEIRTDHQISARRSVQGIVNKKIDFAELWTLLANHRVKLKDGEKRHKCLDLDRELRKTMDLEGDGDTNCDWCAR